MPLTQAARGPHTEGEVTFDITKSLRKRLTPNESELDPKTLDVRMA